MQVSPSQFHPASPSPGFLAVPLIFLLSISLETSGWWWSSELEATQSSEKGCFCAISNLPRTETFRKPLTKAAFFLRTTLKSWVRSSLICLHQACTRQRRSKRRGKGWQKPQPSGFFGGFVCFFFSFFWFKLEFWSCSSLLCAGGGWGITKIY